MCTATWWWEWMDDLQNRPEQIRQFLDKAEEGYDVVSAFISSGRFSAFKISPEQ